jgi:hypothetical protein
MELLVNLFTVFYLVDTEVKCIGTETNFDY